jgi:hypothetical protein
MNQGNGILLYDLFLFLHKRSGRYELMWGESESFFYQFDCHGKDDFRKDYWWFSKSNYFSLKSQEVKYRPISSYFVAAASRALGLNL